uniref:Glia maturation factor beta n=1 Tax=Anas zonorhyncha TaxID=75864 RepID=A0A8B9VBE3_9AVES
MSESLVVCDVAEDLVEKLRKFRFRKETNNAAIIMKIDKDKQLVVLDEEHEGISPDELKDELPERQPRFIVYSYKYQHEDGRVSYPLCFIFSSPVGCKPEQQMMYAGSKNKLVQTAELTKIIAFDELKTDYKNPIDQCNTLNPVHEQACDERPRSVRPYDHHECRHLSLLPERGMVQISILPSIFFLLLIWVSFFLYPPSHC